LKDLDIPGYVVYPINSANLQPCRPEVMVMIRSWTVTQEPRLFTLRLEHRTMMDDAPMTIELGEVARFSCPCCGRDSETVHGFLTDQNGNTSVYFAGFTHGHPDRRLNMILSLGGWGEGAGPEDREAVAMEVQFRDGDVEMSFPPAETSPWFEEEFLGRKLESSQLSDVERQRHRRLAGLAIDKDPRISNYRKNG
jgi:hypothetical protein